MEKLPFITLEDIRDRKLEAITQPYQVPCELHMARRALDQLKKDNIDCGFLETPEGIVLYRGRYT